MKLKSTARLFVASSIAVLLASQDTHAQQSTWDGGGSNGNWTLTTNWHNNATPVWANGINFAGNLQLTANNNVGTVDLSVGGINFLNTATDAFNLTGSRITLVGNINTTAASSALTDTISLAMILNGNRTITTNTNHNLTLSGIISETGGSRSLTKAGAATLTLSGANSYTGATLVNQGVLSLNNLGALGATVSPSPGVNGTSGITLGGASAATLSSTLTGITISAPITTADTGVSSTIAFGRATTAAGNITLNGAIGGNGNVIFSTPTGADSANSTQTINLGAAASYAGSTLVTTTGTNNTLLVKNSSNAANVLPTSTVLTMDGGNGPSGNFIRTVTYDLNGQDQTLAGLTNVARTKRNQRVTSATAATLTIDSSNDSTYGGSGTNGTVSWNTQITGAISLAKKGSGTFTLSGAHTYTGGTTLNAGTLVLNNNSSAGDAAAGISVSGSSAATLQINSGITVANNIVFSNTNASSKGAYTTGTSGSLSSSFAGGTPDTTVSFLGGTSAAGGTLEMSFAGSSLATNDFVRRSDVFTTGGIATAGDTYVLSLFGGLASDSFLARLDDSTNSWIAAGTNFLGSIAYNSGTHILGDYGFDSTNNSVWAVVNYGDSFAAVPEPTSALAGLLLGAGLLRRKRNNAR
jgi:autotransporter-associated beta strand protein